MLQNRLIFGLITSGVSFGLSLLILRDFQRAAFTGLMGFVGSQAAVLVLAGQPDSRLHERQEELRQNIRSLQRKRADAYESLMQLRQEQELMMMGQRPMPRSGNSASPPATAPNPWKPPARETAAAASPNGRSTPLSWSLGTPKEPPVELALNGLETRVKTLSEEEESLQASLHQTLSAKQKADLHLTTRKAELTQLQTKIAAQERQKQQLGESVSQMEAQHQQLARDLDALQNQVKTLEKSRVELNAFLQVSAPKREQSDHAAQSLQTAIAQMQSQISSLRGELGELEGQIIQRRSEKQQLDQTITQLQSQQQATRSAANTPMTASTAVTASPASTARPQPTPDPQSNSQPIQSFAPQPKPPIAPSPPPLASKPASATKPATPIKPASPMHGLAAEWWGLKQSLQPHEFQALRAIAIEANPVPVLKRLAEANLTMPEMLIDTINERALETIGDLILETGVDAASTIIAQEYREHVATLIATSSSS